MWWKNGGTETQTQEVRPRGRELTSIALKEVIVLLMQLTMNYSKHNNEDHTQQIEMRKRTSYIAW